jgi:hypothetical protein
VARPPASAASPASRVPPQPQPAPDAPHRLLQLPGSATAGRDVRELTQALAGELSAVWSITPSAAVLTPGAPRFTFRR